MTTKEAAKFLMVSPQTLRNWDKKGKFKASRHPENNYRLYKISDLERFAKIIGKHIKTGFKLVDE